MEICFTVSNTNIPYTFPGEKNFSVTTSNTFFVPTWRMLLNI